MLKKLRHFICKVRHGHHYHWRFEKGNPRTFGECTNCGHETSGWQLDEAKIARLKNRKQMEAVA